jgi:cell division protein FtsL
MVAQVIKKQIEKIEYREKKIFWTLFSVFVFFLVLYGVLVNKAIMNAVAQQNLEKNIASLNSAVDAMDFQYLNMENNITMDTASADGFVSLSLSQDKFAFIGGAQDNALSVNEN